MIAYKQFSSAALLTLFVCSWGTVAWAEQPSEAVAVAEPAPAPPEHPAGLLHSPDYSGDLYSRSFLSGDWGGSRTDVANRGIQFHVDWTQTYQAIVDGGLDTGDAYGGSLDFNLNLDLMRMGVMPGAMIKLRGESRYGKSVNGMTGVVVPAHVDGFFPLTRELDDNIPITLTNLTYIQFLSEHIGFMVGKFDILDGDPNEFASGRGMSQFMNGSLVFSPVSMLMAPYSTLGAGVIWRPCEGLTLTSTVMNTTDSSTTTGFGDFGDGWTWSTEAQLQYSMGDLPGGMNLGFIYAADNRFSELGSGRFVFKPGDGLSVQVDTNDDTWALYWSGWQYLWVAEASDTPIDLTNGEPDRQGFGLFARAGLADRDTNPIEWAVSGGIGGKGMIPSRERDTFGIGYFYNALQPGRFADPLNVRDYTHGVELFYKIAITPAAHLTLDFQVVDPPLTTLDPAVIFGARMGIRF